jgi:homoserine dehydrogenase
MEELKVGICGWGNVATGLFNALENNADIIAIKCRRSIYSKCYRSKKRQSKM